MYPGQATTALERLLAFLKRAKAHWARVRGTGVSTLPRHEQYQLMDRSTRFRWEERYCADLGGEWCDPVSERLYHWKKGIKGGQERFEIVGSVCSDIPTGLP